MSKLSIIGIFFILFSSTAFAIDLSHLDQGTIDRIIVDGKIEESDDPKNHKCLFPNDIVDKMEKCARRRDALKETADNLNDVHNLLNSNLRQKRNDCLGTRNRYNKLQQKVVSTESEIDDIADNGRFEISREEFKEINKLYDSIRGARGTLRRLEIKAKKDCDLYYQEQASADLFNATTSKPASKRYKTEARYCEILADVNDKCENERW